MFQKVVSGPRLAPGSKSSHIHGLPCWTDLAATLRALMEREWSIASGPMAASSDTASTSATRISGTYELEVLKAVDSGQPGAICYDLEPASDISRC